VSHFFPPLDAGGFPTIGMFPQLAVQFITVADQSGTQSTGAGHAPSPGLHVYSGHAVPPLAAAGFPTPGTFPQLAVQVAAEATSSRTQLTGAGHAPSPGLHAYSGHGCPPLDAVGFPTPGTFPQLAVQVAAEAASLRTQLTGVAVVVGTSVVVVVVVPLVVVDDFFVVDLSFLGAAFPSGHFRLPPCALQSASQQ